MSVLNLRVIANALAALVAAVGAVMFVPAAYSMLTGPNNGWSFWIPGTTALALGVTLFFLTRSRRNRYVSRQNIFLMVVVCWLGVVLVGAAPFLLYGAMGPVDAFFNSMAGFTTTGAATVNPEGLSPALLLWRSLSQWIGGIGIIVLFVAIAPMAGFGATQLYSAEAATPVQERITPRIRDTVKVLAFVYGGLTLGGVVVLHLVGMGTFDAVNYALSTVSTGGFSTDSSSVAAFDSWAVELAITVGMVLAGTNFAIYYIAARRGLGRAVGNAELVTYLGVILASTILITVDLRASDLPGLVGRGLPRSPLPERKPHHGDRLQHDGLERLAPLLRSASRADHGRRRLRGLDSRWDEGYPGLPSDAATPNRRCFVWFTRGPSRPSCWATGCCPSGFGWESSASSSCTWQPWPLALFSSPCTRFPWGRLLDRSSRV